MKKQIFPLIFTALLIAPNALQPSEAKATGIPVVNVANLAQNILEAVRALQSNINEAKMIANEIKELTKLPTTMADDITRNLNSLFKEVGEVQGLMADLSSLQEKFEDLYPNFAEEAGIITKEKISETLKKTLNESHRVNLWCCSNWSSSTRKCKV